MNPTALREAFARLPPGERARRLPSLYRALTLAELKQGHKAAHLAWLASGDDEAWDGHLMTLGRAALELRDSYQVRLDCESGTGTCGCYGCAEHELRRVAEAKNVNRWTEGEMMREGSRLHALWVHDQRMATPAKPQPGAVFDTRKQGPIGNWFRGDRGLSLPGGLMEDEDAD